MSSSSEAAEDAPAIREIRQIIPTSGHLVVFFDEENGEPWVDQLVGWALVVEKPANSSAESSPKIIALVSDGKEVVLADEVPNFLGYMAPGGGLEDWKEEATKAWEQQLDDQQEGPSSERPAQTKPTLWNE